MNRHDITWVNGKHAGLGLPDLPSETVLMVCITERDLAPEASTLMQNVELASRLYTPLTTLLSHRFSVIAAPAADKGRLALKTTRQ